MTADLFCSVALCGCTGFASAFNYLLIVSASRLLLPHYYGNRGNCAILFPSIFLEILDYLVSEGSGTLCRNTKQIVVGFDHCCLSMHVMDWKLTTSPVVRLERTSEMWVFGFYHHPHNASAAWASEQGEQGQQLLPQVW